MFETDEAAKRIHRLLAAQDVTRKPGELPKCFDQEVGPDPISYPAACSSEYLDALMETMRIEFDGLVASGTFGEVTENHLGVQYRRRQVTVQVEGRFAWYG